MANLSFDLIILGSGPGGYVGAIRASQLGMRVAVVEEDALGGVCLNRGCIPTKSLLKSAELFDDMKKAESYGIQAKDLKIDFAAVIQRSSHVAEKMSKGVQFLMKKNKIEVFKGRGKLIGDRQVEVKDVLGGRQIVEAKHIIVATGARARSLPTIEVDEVSVITYKTALKQKKCPRRLLVIGAGAIGVEFAYFYNSMGAEVTIVEYQNQLLPIEDRDVAKELTRSFKKQKIKPLVSTSVKAIKNLGPYLRVSCEDNGDGRVQEIEVDQVLVAVGVVGNTDDLGCEEVGVQLDGSFIEVDKHYKTSVEDVYAIGDVIGAPLLAHVASAEAIRCVEWLAGHHTAAINYDQIPGCTYCHPQVASIGLTEDKAREIHGEVIVGKFPFSASGKASAIGDNTGFVKKIFDKKYKQLLGVHIVGPEATELLTASSIAMSHEATAESILQTVHAHPTLGEALMEASAEALGEAIHI